MRLVTARHYLDLCIVYQCQEHSFVSDMMWISVVIKGS